MTAPAAGTVTVLGASGFIGGALSIALARRGHHVRAVSRARADRVPPRHPRIEPVIADVTDHDRLVTVVRGSDAVVNLVLQERGWRHSDADPLASETLNVAALRHVVDTLSASRGCPVVLQAGAVSQVGLPPGGPINGSEPDQPVTVYDRHKLAAERVLFDASDAGHVRATVLRMPTVYGAGHDGGATDNGVISAMARRALDGQPLTMWHDGTVRRDAIHVDDVASAFVTALDQIDRLDGRHWLIGSGHGCGLGEIFSLVADRVAAVTGRPAVPVCTVEPPPTALVTDFHSIDIDISPFTARTGWRPRVPLADGIHRTVEHLLGTVDRNHTLTSGAAGASRRTP